MMSKKHTLTFFINHAANNLNAIKPYNITFSHLVLVLKGNCSYVVNGEKIVLNENDALLIPSGSLRERFSKNEYLHIVIFNFFEGATIDDGNVKIFRNTVNQTIRKLLDVYPYRTFELSDDQLSSIPTDKQYVVIENIFECILFELLDSLKYSTQNPHIINALKYINDNITLPLTLNNVCKKAHLSKEYTSRLFKQEMGLTVSEYINNQKLSLAKDMLTNQNMTIKSISATLGYENYTYFTKIFKEKFHISPQKMRNELKKNRE